MKKKYQQPAVAIIYVKLQQMIAASERMIIDKTVTKDPSLADSRFLDWDGWDDDDF